jgi:hypothetical protein
MATCSDLKLQLAEAEAAHHKLVTGALEETLRYGEKHIIYTRARVPELVSHIASLRAQVASVCRECVPGLRRAIRPVFSDH